MNLGVLPSKSDAPQNQGSPPIHEQVFNRTHPFRCVKVFPSKSDEPPQGDTALVLNEGVDAGLPQTRGDWPKQAPKLFFTKRLASDSSARVGRSKPAPTKRSPVYFGKVGTGLFPHRPCRSPSHGPSAIIGRVVPPAAVPLPFGQLNTWTVAFRGLSGLSLLPPKVAP